MSFVRFRAHGVSLELRGSESFLLRQLSAFAPDLGPVDLAALSDHSPVRSDLRLAAPAEPSTVATRLDAPAPPPAAPANGHSHAVESAPEPSDAFLDFCRSHPFKGKDQQTDAALLFAYWLHRHEGSTELRIGDLLRCCIRAGVDTRNFNHAIGGLVRRDLLLPLGNGNAYRLSDRGVAAVENRT